MIRPPKATALLALVALLGAEAPAEAGHSDGRRHLTVSPLRPAPAAVPVIPPAAPAATWQARIDARLAALAESAPAGVAAAPPSQTPVARHLDDLLASAPGVSIGVAVRDLHTGAPIFFHNADQALNPASNNKLVTAIAAAELLGRDYRFSTQVLREGRTLYIVGDGDPSLQVEDVAGLAAAAAAEAGDDTFDRIVIDDSFFSARRFGPGYDPAGPGFSYEAPSGALSLQFNTVEIRVAPGAAEGPTHVSVSPECAHVRIVNEATTGRGGDLDISTWADGDQTVVHVRGRMRAGATPLEIRRRITDPGMYLGTTFAHRFATMTDAEPLPVSRGEVPTSARVLVRHDSEPLTDVLRSALLYSNNFTTEQVLRTLGARRSGAPGDWDNGAAALRAFWIAIGLDPSDLTLVNGSGYSHRGRVSPDALVRLLALTARPGSDAAAVVASLPAPGEHGTLRRRLGMARGRLRAKTGTMRGASALSGIISRHEREAYGFSILVNGPISTDRSRRLQDRIVVALVGELPG